MALRSQSKRIVSFDLDGTLVDTAYTNWVWEVGVPEIYARKHGMSLEEATATIIAEYERVGEDSLEWYDIAYWFDFFNLPGRWQELLDSHRAKIALFPEALDVIRMLHRHYDLMVTSNAARPFVERELQETGIESYFCRVVSATSDFRAVKKTPAFYKRLCSTIKADPARITHIGDHFEHDYAAPRKSGIESYFLIRNGTPSQPCHSVGNLRDFARVLLKH